MNKQGQSTTVVFIHGLFINPISWEYWINYFEDKGFQCYAPAYPYHEGNPADLWKNIPSELGTLNFKRVIEMQKGVAEICIHSAPPKNIFTLKWSFLKSLWPLINPFKGNSVCKPTVKWLHYACCNTMTIKETEVVFKQLVIPESRNIPRSIIMNQGIIDFRKPHLPLLIISGSKDHIIPSSLNKKNHRAYKDKTSRIDFKEFEGRTHYTCGQENCEMVAEYINGWIKSLN